MEGRTKAGGGKLTEIRDQLAKETGVSAVDVEKVLNRLGLERSLQSGKGNVTLENLRLAVGPAL